MSIIFHSTQQLLGFCRSTYDPARPDDEHPITPDPLNTPIDTIYTLTHDGEHGLIVLSRLGVAIGVAFVAEGRCWVWFWDEKWYTAAYQHGCEPITKDDWEGWAGSMIRQALSNPNTKESRKPLFQQIIQAYEG